MKADQLCLTLQSHGLYSSPGSSVHGILQAGILEWVSVPFSTDLTQVFWNADRFFTVWATLFLTCLPKLPQKKLVCGLKESQVTVTVRQLPMRFPRATDSTWDLSDPNLHPLYVEESDNLPTRPDLAGGAVQREPPSPGWARQCVVDQPQDPLRHLREPKKAASLTEARNDQSGGKKMLNRNHYTALQFPGKLRKISSRSCLYSVSQQWERSAGLKLVVGRRNTQSTLQQEPWETKPMTRD